MAPIVLGYWKIRGLAQSIRLLLGYTKTEFIDELYECGDGPTFDKSCWFDIKESLPFPFSNLPYLIDGDVKLTQSNAIHRYIARKHNMVGETEEEKQKVDLIENQMMDLRNDFVMMLYLTKPEDYDVQRTAYITRNKIILTKFEKFLGDNKYFAGDKLTFVDFIAYELLDQHRSYSPDLLEACTNLKAFLDRFEKISEIAEFMASGKLFKGPVNNKSALWK